MKQALIAGGSLLLSSLACGQTANLYNPAETGWVWLDGKTITIAYSSAGAASGVSNATMLQVLADIEARLDGLNVPGLEVAIDTNVRNTNCDARQRNQVLVCWEAINDNIATFVNIGGMEGTTGYQLANVVLDYRNAWTPETLKTMIMHELMHVIGFGHPEGSNNSVLNGATDLTPIDITGLQTQWADRCMYTYNATDQTVVLPFVTYRGNAYNVTVHNDGNNQFSLAQVAMWTPAAPPKTPCQNLAVDDTDQLHVPRVNVGGASMWADLKLVGSRLVLMNSGRN
jgi:hypothetical protein